MDVCIRLTRKRIEKNSERERGSQSVEKLKTIAVCERFLFTFFEIFGIVRFDKGEKASGRDSPDRVANNARNVVEDERVLTKSFHDTRTMQGNRIGCVSRGPRSDRRNHRRRRRWTISRGYRNYGTTNSPRRDPGGNGSLFSRKAAAQWAAIPHAAITDITNPPLIGTARPKHINSFYKSLHVKGSLGRSGRRTTTSTPIYVFETYRTLIASHPIDSSLAHKERQTKIKDQIRGF